MVNEKSKGKIIGAFLGTIIEYYDYSLYGFAAGIIALKFFPTSDYLTNLTNAFAFYAVAYFSKPIGALIFGRVGDVYGRKAALSITIIGIAIPTIIIGLMPEYSKIGLWSTIILLLCRIMQGIFVAGEYDGAAIYVIEHLDKKHHFLASSITRCTGVLGLLFGIGITNLFNSHIFPEWGWRIPFLLSLPFALIVSFFRKKFIETPDFNKNKKLNISVDGLYHLLITHWQIILMIVFLASGFGTTYQIAIIFMKQYLPIIMPQTSELISSFSILIVVSFALSMPIAGFLADKFSEITILKFALIGVIISSALFIIATFYQMLNLLLPACLMLACFVSPINALAHGIIIKAFSVNNRYRGISFGHTIGSMLSGSANYICLTVMRKVNFQLFPIIYLTFFAFLSYYIVKYFLSYIKMKERAYDI